MYKVTVQPESDLQSNHKTLKTDLFPQYFGQCFGSGWIRFFSPIQIRLKPRFRIRPVFILNFLKLTYRI